MRDEKITKILCLRYGLPVNFQAILIHPNKKSIKRLRDVLNQLYGHLDGSAAGSAGMSDVSSLYETKNIKISKKN